MVSQTSNCMAMYDKGFSLRGPDMSPSHMDNMGPLKKPRKLELVLENLLSDQLCWKPNRLHIGEVVICNADRNPLLILGFRRVERYSPPKVTRQFGWSEKSQSLNKL